MRKDIKKSSYYVWFLGAQEAKGLRGLEYITPVIKSLVEQEREMEPFKVTLQVSYKGLKIVQNVPGTGAAPGVTGVTVGAAIKGGKSGNVGGKPEVVKHLIPHHAVTCVHRQEDLVACILLLYNPVTKCPVHVHAYRCDSVETATVLHGQLRVLIERPDNQKKLSEIEARLTAKGLLLPQTASRRRVAPPPSDGRSTRESESSGGSSSERLSGVGHQERIANLYDSLAAELREKLKSSGGTQTHAPILLPPRDYDTVHRQKGNLTEVIARRCLNMNIVGVNATAPTDGATGLKPSSTQGQGPGKIGSSGGSSGIGSDHAPSPDQETDARFLDNHSTSDEEWYTETTKDSLFLVQPVQGNWRSSGGEMSLPRARHLNSSGFHSTTPDNEQALRRRRVNSSNSADYHHCREPADESSIHPDMIKLKKQHSMDSYLQPGSNVHQPVNQRRRKNAEERQRSPSPINTKSTVGSLTPRDRFNDAKEKFLSLEREKQEEQERQERVLVQERRKNNQPIEPPISPSVMPVLRSRPMKSWSRGKESEEEVEELSQHRGLTNDDNYKHHNERDYLQGLRREPSYFKSQSHGSIPDSEDNSLMQHGKSSLPFARRPEDQRRKVNPSPPTRILDNHNYSTSEEKFNPQIHRRYASPGREHIPIVKPRKERCKSPVVTTSRQIIMKYPEDPPVEDTTSRYIGKIPRSHLNMNPVPFAENNSAIPLERYRSPPRAATASRPSQRHQRYHTPNSEDDDDHDYRNMMHPEIRNYPQRVQYDNNDKKRMSMYESIEDERRRSSNELAKEFKRRSFQDHGPALENCANNLDYQELDDHERYPGLDRETARVHPTDEISNSSPRYRHSYAEPYHQYQPQLQTHHEILHHTNSSLSSGRVGIAAIHPY